MIRKLVWSREPVHFSQTPGSDLLTKISISNLESSKNHKVHNQTHFLENYCYQTSCNLKLVRLFFKRNLIPMGVFSPFSDNIRNAALRDGKHAQVPRMQIGCLRVKCYASKVIALK